MRIHEGTAVVAVEALREADTDMDTDTDTDTDTGRRAWAPRYAVRTEGGGVLECEHVVLTTGAVSVSRFVSRSASVRLSVQHSSLTALQPISDSNKGSPTAAHCVSLLPFSWFCCCTSPRPLAAVLLLPPTSYCSLLAAEPGSLINLSFVPAFLPQGPSSSHPS